MQASSMPSPLEDRFKRNRSGIRAECAQGVPVVHHLPYFYAIHLNVPCNQSCIMCAPHGNTTDKRMITFDDFMAFFDQVKDVAEHITLIGGETFMYPWIAKVLRVLADHKVAVTINTNATMLTPLITPPLLAVHELNLKCSIDASSRDVYRRVRGSDVFDKVMGNVRAFSDAAEGKPNIRVIMVFVVMKENLGDVLPFVEMAKEIDAHRVEFHPVRHVTNWQVSNGTGWHFDGREQSCEAFKDEYNSVLSEAAARCEAAELAHEVILL